MLKEKTTDPLWGLKVKDGDHTAHCAQEHSLTRAQDAFAAEEMNVPPHGEALQPVA